MARAVEGNTDLILQVDGDNIREKDNCNVLEKSPVYFNQ